VAQHRGGATGHPTFQDDRWAERGARAGKEVVQIYLRDVESSLQRPTKELKGFAKVALEPGETRTVTLTPGPDALSFYDDLRQGWVAESGTFEVLVGHSSRDIRLRGTFELGVPAEARDAKGPDVARAGSLSVRSVLRDILDDPEAKGVLRKHLGAMADGNGPDPGANRRSCAQHPDAGGPGRDRR